VKQETGRGVQDYLAQIKRLEEDGQRCTATIVAQSLGVSLPSASEMLKRLAGEGYLERDREGTVTLTPQGRPLAHKVLRRHRLVERLLTDVLGMPWHQVHQEAHRLKHAISDRVEEHLATSLSFPEYCPHGAPATCPVDRRDLRPLDAVEGGEEVGIGQISEIKVELLTYLDEMGIKPGVIIKILQVDPFGGLLTLQTDAGSVGLSREVGAHIQICPPDQADWINRRALDS
jgi:DtxR family Mn-dependent transcriptional regulator